MRYPRYWAFALISALLLMSTAIAACNPFVSDADVVSENVSKAADQFEVFRRVVFYNGITGEYILTIEGYCSLGNYDAAGTVTVTCKVGENEYKKHFLGLSDNVTYFAEHMDATTADAGQYRVVFKPSVIVPDIEAK